LFTYIQSLQPTTVDGDKILLCRLFVISIVIREILFAPHKWPIVNPRSLEEILKTALQGMSAVTSGSNNTEVDHIVIVLVPDIKWDGLLDGRRELNSRLNG
jgi:hypothetical protein